MIRLAPLVIFAPFGFLAPLHSTVDWCVRVAALALAVLAALLLREE